MIQSAIHDEAVEWFVLLASGEASENDRRRFEIWRQANAGHEQAWQRTQRITHRFASIPKSFASSSVTILAQPLRRNAGRLKTLARACSIVALALFGYQASQHMDWTADAVTAIGEQRTMTLVDGTRMTLDTNTAVDIDFSETRREIRLRRGQVSITTGHGLAARGDFVVTTSAGSAVALGTRFTVLHEDAVTRVAVLESRVAIYPGSSSAPALTLNAGEAARFDKRGVSEHTAASSYDASWDSGVLVADSMRLDEFVAILSRHSTNGIGHEAAIGKLRISGSFPLQDTDRVLRALSHTLPLRVASVEGRAVLKAK